MTNSEIRKIALIGAGKLATNFAFTLKKSGYSILQVYDRSVEPGKKLAGKVSASYIGNLNELTERADLYALAVSDSALKEIAEKIRLNDQLIIHFSGTADISVLKGSSLNYGILYPPQTFTIKPGSGFLNIPLCLEANNQESERILTKFAGTLSEKIFKVNSYQRTIIHLSAIFASNFTNFMYAVAEDLLTENDLPMDLLQPIIKKTASNARHKDIYGFQTGPAIREDLKIMKTHLDFLSDKPEYKKIYQILTDSIIKFKHQNDKL
jgi:predicted short-subunit dehydrogenase-like oxidoreductase (DUF2520 family)